MLTVRIRCTGCHHPDEVVVEHLSEVAVSICEGCGDGLEILAISEAVLVEPRLTPVTRLPTRPSDPEPLAA